MSYLQVFHLPLIAQRRKKNFLMSMTCKVCVVVCMLYHTTKLIQQGNAACVSLYKLSIWSPLWESLAVELILLSHTLVSVPHLSVQPQGPSCSSCTPGFTAFFYLTSRLRWLSAPIETELDNKKGKEQDKERVKKKRGKKTYRWGRCRSRGKE